MGTCRGWPGEGRGTMGTQLLQLLGKAIILPAQRRRPWRGGGESSGVLFIRRLLEALCRAGGVSTAACVPLRSNNCTFCQGSPYF